MRNLILTALFLIPGLASAEWKLNPYTQRMDYYESKAAVVLSTGALQAEINALHVTTATLTQDLATEVSRATTRENAIGASTGTLKTQIDAVAVSTGTLTQDLATEVSNRGIADNAIILSTGAINADLQAYKSVVQASTASIYSALNSTASALTAEIARATARENDLGYSTGTIKASLDAVILSTAPLKDYANWNTAYSWGNHALAGYLTAETDPIVGAVTGIVKANGAGVISAATPGTDYLTPTGDGSNLTGVIQSTATGTYGIAASQNVLKSGDTMTGNLTLNSGSNTRHVYGYIDSTQRYDLTTGQTGIGGAALTLYDWNPAARILLSAYPTEHGHNRIGHALSLGKITAPTHTLDVSGGGVFSSSVTVGAGFYGSGAGLTSLPAGELVGTVPTGSVDLSTVTANHVLKTGDTMTGALIIQSGDLQVGGTSGSLLTWRDTYLASLSASKVLVGGGAPNTHKVNVDGGAVFTSSITASAFYGDGSNLTGVIQSTATGTYGIAASQNVLKSGDTMTGQLTVQGSAFSVGGSTFVVTGGKVGIGTASPSTSLEIAETYPAGGPYIKLKRTDDTALYGGIQFANSSGSVLWSIETNNRAGQGIEINEGATNRVYVAPTGLFGIGTMAPASKLHVSSGTFFGDGNVADIIMVGTPLNATTHYARIDTLAADTAGPPASGDCDAATEVGRQVMSTRYSATAEHRIWYCTQTGAATYGWKYLGLQTP